MPTRKIFDLIVVEWILLEIAWALPKLWAHRKSMSDASTPVKAIAGAIEAVH